MEVSNDFIENSIIAKYYSESFNDDNFDHEFHNEIYYLCIDKVFNKFKINSEKISRTLTDFKQKKYTDARIGMGIRNDYINYQKDISSLRFEIKSLISGIITTTTISNECEIAEYKRKWLEYCNSSWHHYHQYIYLEFLKVKTMDELIKFNEYFHKYILDLIYKFTDIFLQRMRYTVLYLSRDITIGDNCKDIYKIFSKFNEDIENHKLNTIQNEVLTNRSQYINDVMQIKQSEKHHSC